MRVVFKTGSTVLQYVGILLILLCANIIFMLELGRMRKVSNYRVSTAVCRNGISRRIGDYEQI